MRALRNAVVTFGAVVVPVGVATTASRKDVTFKTLHKTCHTPIKQQHRCPTCDVELADDDKVKGFEFVKGHFVEVSDRELEAVAAPRSDQIVISKFVDEGVLTPFFVEKNYFLIPNEKLLRPYEIVADALVATGTCGIGTATLWKKEYPVAVVASEDRVLFLLLLFCADEVRSPVEISSMLRHDVTVQEAEMMRFIVEHMKSEASVEDLRSESRDRLMALIEQKTLGDEAVMPTPAKPPEPTVDYMAALKETVALVSEKK